MEILIIGGIFVALMVVISTKIKKNAAKAFERESIETEDFRIIKPEGFINPIRDDSKFAFEAYSKEFGEKDERNIWKAQVYLTVSAGLTFAAVCKNAKQETGEILSENFLKDAPEGEKICLIESEKAEREVVFYEFRKIVESRKQQKTYDLKISILKAFRDDYVSKVNELMNSFQLK